MNSSLVVIKEVEKFEQIEVVENSILSVQSDTAQEAFAVETSVPEAAIDHHINSWETQAASIVVFQAKQAADQVEQRVIIFHVETNKALAESGEASSRIFNGTLQREGEELINAAEQIVPTQAEPEASVPEIEPFMQLEIAQLRLVSSNSTDSPITIDKHHRFFSKAIQNNHPFCLEISLAFTQLTIANSANIQIRCHARELAMGVTTLLGEITVAFAAEAQGIQTVSMPDLVLLQPGIYRLKVSAIFENSSAIPVCFRIPRLSVM